MENNCKVKVIYLDTYINILTPKTIIINKIDFMTDYPKVIVNHDVKMGNELKETKKKISKYLLNQMLKQMMNLILQRIIFKKQ